MISFKRIYLFSFSVILAVFLIGCGRQDKADQLSEKSAVNEAVSVVSSSIKDKKTGEAKTGKSIVTEGYIVHLLPGALVPPPGEYRPGEYTLNDGKLLVSVKEFEGEFSVYTPVAVVGVRGTDFSIAYYKKNRELHIAVFSGIVFVRFNQTEKEIPASSYIVVGQDGEKESGLGLSNEDKSDYAMLQALPAYKELYRKSLKDVK